MRQRTNPWPAFADLFSATLIVTFAGMVMMTAAYQHEVKSLKATQVAMEQAQTAVRKARAEADRIIEQVKQSLQRDSAMKSITRQCGDDTCIDLYIQFDENDSTIRRPEQLDALKGAIGQLKMALDGVPDEQRKEIEIVIEGHTDKTLPKDKNQKLDDRGKYLYNWDLSARRATSVAYEFKQMGVVPEGYRIVAIGYAASKPLCDEDAGDEERQKECRERNRRTTLILRGDTREIEKRLGQEPPQQ